MKKTVFILAGLLLLPCALNAADKASSPDDNTLYTLGFITARNLGAYELSKKELKEVIKGIEDAAQGKQARVEPSAYVQKLQELGMERWRSKAAAEKAASDKFLAEATKASGVRKLGDGVWIQTLKAGDGASPTVKDVVKVHYEGKLRDGKVFDSSRARGTPVTFPLEGVIPCWQSAITAMKKGETARIYCSAATAYEEMGNPPVIPGNAALVFEAELLDIEQAPTAAPAPKASDKKASQAAPKKAPAKKNGAKK